MSINHILNHTLAKEVARQVVELAAVKTELAEERRKREEADKKLKEPICKIMPQSFDYSRNHVHQGLFSLAAQQSLAMQGAQSRYGMGIGGAAQGIFG